MKTAWNLIALALAGGLSGLPLTAAPATPAERLRVAESAGERCRYQATFTCREVRGNATKTITVDISHQPGATRYAYSTPEHRDLVVIERGEQVVRLNPADQTATLARVPRKPSRLDLLLANYSVDIQSGATVAGRATDTLAIQHKASGRLARRIWMDQEHGLILRSEEYDQRGQVRARTECQRIQWPPELAASLFEIPPGWRVIEAPLAETTWDAARLAQAVGFEFAPPATPPPGFVLEDMSLYPCPCGAKAVQLRYTDGLASGSLFIQTPHCNSGGGGRGQGMGPGLGMGKGPPPGKGPGQGRGRGWGAQGEGRPGSCACERVAAVPGKVQVKHTAHFTYIWVGDLDEASWQKFSTGLE